MPLKFIWSRLLFGFKSVNMATSHFYAQMQCTTPFRSYHMYTSCLREAFQFQINCYQVLHRTITEHSNCTRWFVGYPCTPDSHPLVNSGMLSIKADRAKCQNSSCKVVGRNDDELIAYVCTDCYIEEELEN